MYPLSDEGYVFSIKVVINKKEDRIWVVEALRVSTLRSSLGFFDKSGHDQKEGPDDVSCEHPAFLSAFRSTLCHETCYFTHLIPLT